MTNTADTSSTFHKEDLFLVVGSTRSPHASVGAIGDEIQDNTHCDFSHRTTFEGRATTLDQRPCALPEARHIVGDVRYFDFSRYKIQQVYLERLPTYDENLIKKGTLFSAIDVHSLYIQNLIKAMPSGARMVIEWEPYISLGYYSLSNIKQMVRNTVNALKWQRIP